MSLIFGLMVILAGSLVKRYDANNIDYVFWIGTIFVFVLFYAIEKLSEQ